MAENAQNAEGTIAVTVTIAADRIAEVDIGSTRAPAASRILEGRGVTQAVALLPTLFSLCGEAQGIAGLRAAEAALGITVSPATAAARNVLVGTEAIGQILWRLLLDVPTAIGRDPAFDSLRAARAAIARVPRLIFQKSAWTVPGGTALKVNRKGLLALADRIDALIEDEIFGLSGLDGSPLADADRFLFWMAEADTLSARLFRSLGARRLARFGDGPTVPMPALDAAVIGQRLDSDDDGAFRARPEIDGTVYETGPLARHWQAPLIAELRAEFGTGLTTRFAARLIDLVDFAAALRSDIDRLADEDAAAAALTGSGSGTGVVETARGRLFHHVAIADGRVTKYRVLAPTEWNFHGHGPLYHGLCGAPVSNRERLHEGLSLLLMALDPCVSFDLKIAHK